MILQALGDQRGGYIYPCTFLERWEVRQEGKRSLSAPFLILYLGHCVGICELPWFGLSASWIRDHRVNTFHLSLDRYVGNSRTASWGQMYLVTRQMLLIFKHAVLFHVVVYINVSAFSRDNALDSSKCRIVHVTNTWRNTQKPFYAVFSYSYSSGIKPPADGLRFSFFPSILSCFSCFILTVWVCICMSAKCEKRN